MESLRSCLFPNMKRWALLQIEKRGSAISEFTACVLERTLGFIYFRLPTLRMLLSSSFNWPTRLSGLRITWRAPGCQVHVRALAVKARHQAAAVSGLGWAVQAATGQMDEQAADQVVRRVAAHQCVDYGS